MKEISPEKRVLLAFALAFLVLAAWSSYMRRRYPPPEPPTTEPTPAAVEPAPEQPVVQKPLAEEAREPAPERKPEPELLGVKEGSEEQIIAVETDKARIQFSTRGAVVQSWRLKDYADDEGDPVELIQGRATGLGYPLALELSDPEQEELLNGALFVAEPELAELRAPAELLFEWSDGHLIARKRFRFGEGYRVEVETEVLEAGQPVPHRLAWRGGFGERANDGTAIGMAEAQVFVREPAELKRQPAQHAGQETGWLWKKPSPFPYSGEAAYAGIEDRYFAALFLPRYPQLDVSARTRQWTPEGQDKPVVTGEIAVGTRNGNTLQLFVCPREREVLAGIEPSPFASGQQAEVAEELVDFGWFWWVAKPLFLAMRWMYAHWIPNYGWVIVVLTVAINLALFPLRWKSMQSSFKMQKVAPQVKAIQARYKQYKFNDPRKQQMQQEIMALYKEHGINPVGGCLPLLVQLPFFYGFYKVVAISIDMRHAPWILWIRDLSQKDPYYVLPIVMAATMYFSMRLTPMTGVDPRQQKLMQMMMLLFAFMFLQVSAGLVLYWLASSVVGLGQQYWILRWQRQHEAAEQEAARRRKKKKRKRDHSTGESE